MKFVSFYYILVIFVHISIFIDTKKSSSNKAPLKTILRKKVDYEIKNFSSNNTDNQTNVRVYQGKCYVKIHGYLYDLNEVNGLVGM
jgi:hypothetical protein